MNNGRRAVSSADGDPGLFTRADEAFHAALAESSHNIFLIHAVAHIRSLQSHVSILELGRNAAHADRAIKEHELILEAVRTGDDALAADRASEHVQRSLQDYREAIEHRLATATDRTRP